MLHPGRAVPGGSTAGVLPPRDVVGIERRAEHIEVAVAVHVGGIDGNSAVEGPVDGVLHPGRAVPVYVCVLPPRDVVGIERRAKHIEVAVAVHVGGKDGMSAVEVHVDGALGPGRAVPGRVLPPRDVAGKDRRAEHIEVAVAVHIGGKDGTSVVEVPVDVVLGGIHGIAMDRFVLPPRDVVGIDRRAEHIEVAVAVHVGGKDGKSEVEVPVDGVLHPGRAVPVYVCVLPPRDVLGETSRAEHIEVAVAVHVGGKDGKSAVEVHVDGVLHPGRAVPVRVLPPRDVVGKERRAEHIEVAVAVHIGGIDGNSEVEVHVDGVLHPGRAVGGGSTAGVLPPRDVVGIARRAEHIEVAVAVHVGGKDGMSAVEGPVDGVLGGKWNLPGRDVANTGDEQA